MLWMEIFLKAGFQPAQLLGIINRIETPPLKLKKMGLFSREPIRAEFFAVDVYNSTLNLIKTSKRGAPLEGKKSIKGQLKRFDTLRIAKQHHILASAFQFIREMGTENQILQVQAEILKHMSGPEGLIADIDYTKENMMLGAIQGKVLDSDDSVLFNWFTELGITQSAEITFDFSAYTGSDAVGAALSKLLNQKVVRPMSQKAKGARYSGIHAFCGGAFFDDLVGCGETQKLYENQQTKNEMIDGYFGRTFKYAGILFEEYSGEADTKVKIADNEVKFFPSGTGNTVFKEVLSPGERFEDIGTEGQDVYALTIPDLERDMFVDLEAYSYPAYFCQRPEMLFRGKI